MKLTGKELIRLQKEVCLLEHGFYEVDINQWFYDDYPKNIDRIRKILNDDDAQILSSYWRPIIERIWFKEQFPEFFVRVFLRVINLLETTRSFIVLKVLTLKFL